MPPSKINIPNILIDEGYDQKYDHALIHYDSLSSLASFFGRNMQVHRHSQYWQIHFIENGQTTFQIDDREYAFNEPCCFVTPAAIPHSFVISESSSGHVITINQSVVWDFIQENTLDNFHLGGTSGFCISKGNCNNEQTYDWNLLEQTLSNIKREWEHNAPGNKLVINELTRILLVALLRLSPTINHGSIVDDEELRIFHKFSDIIEAHFTDHWNLQSYTKELGVSENRLNQICKRISSNSPKRLINERLLQEARRLLTHTSSSCNEISYSLGFSDPTYFSRFFKSKTGKTAQTYRQDTLQH